MSNNKVNVAEGKTKLSHEAKIFLLMAVMNGYIDFAEFENKFGLIDNPLNRIRRIFGIDSPSLKTNQRLSN